MKPLGKNLIIRPLPTISSIIQPHPTPPTSGTVIAIGNTCTETKIGDLVRFPQNHGITISHNNEQLLLISENLILYRQCIEASDFREEIAQ